VRRAEGKELYANEHTCARAASYTCDESFCAVYPQQASVFVIENARVPSDTGPVRVNDVRLCSFSFSCSCSC